MYLKNIDIVVLASVEVVVFAWMDVSCFSEWMPKFVSVRQRRGEFRAVGSECVWQMLVGEQMLEQVTFVEVNDLPAEIVMRSEFYLSGQREKFKSSRVRVQFLPEGACGTRVILEWDIERFGEAAGCVGGVAGTPGDHRDVFSLYLGCLKGFVEGVVGG